jgi:hypothetical protein
MSRFSFRIIGYDLKSGITLQLFDKNGHAYKKIPADGSVSGGDDGKTHFWIDSLKSVPNEKEKFYSRFVGRANHIITFYRMISPYASVVAFLSYIYATILLIREVIKKRVLKTLPVWLVLTGIASTFMLFMVCMCIISTNSFYTLFYLYTAPAYILFLMFCAVSVCWVFETVLEFRKRDRL